MTWWYWPLRLYAFSLEAGLKLCRSDERETRRRRELANRIADLAIDIARMEDDVYYGLVIPEDMPDVFATITVRSNEIKRLECQRQGVPYPIGEV